MNRFCALVARALPSGRSLRAPAGLAHADHAAADGAAAVRVYALRTLAGVGLIVVATTTSFAQAVTIADAAPSADPAPALARAEAALSDRYATLWSAQPAAERFEFRARERAWLNVGRWQEKDACVAARGADTGIACLTEVTWQRVRALAPVAAATARISSSR